MGAREGSIMKNFMGKDGFQWFVGVVEDRADPKKLGRVRVRCLGYHTENLDKLPTDDLPWAHPMNPITSATVSGIGQTPLGVVEGTWVVGFFTDGRDAQQPMIMGTLPGVPAKLPTKDDKVGFQDYINGNYPKYTETDVNRLAVNATEEDDNGDVSESNPHNSLTIRKADRDLAVGTAQIDGVVEGVAPFPEDLDTDNGGKWDEPKFHMQQPTLVIMSMRAKAATYERWTIHQAPSEYMSDMLLAQAMRSAPMGQRSQESKKITMRSLQMTSTAIYKVQQDIR